jgi:CheY-like chemotaxis protein
VIASNLPTVLIVDDDPDFRELAGGALRAAGYGVAEAGGVRAALRVLDRIVFDLVVIDAVLPEGSGYDLVVRFRADRFDVPIVFISAHLAEVDVPVSGMVKVLAKPLQPVALVEVVGQLLGERALPNRDPSGEVALSDALADVTKEYAADLSSNLLRLEGRLRSARSRFVEELADIRVAAHRLRGSAGSYGFEEVGEAAGDLEDALAAITRAGGTFSEPDWWEVQRALRRARAAAG